MASTIILSDNGASSGSAGLKQTAGNDGVLILQTTTSGGTATNAVYVDNNQYVGLGTSSPSTWATKQVIYNGQLTVTGGGYDGSFADSIFFGGNAEGTTYRNKISNSLSSNATNQQLKLSVASGSSTFVDALTMNGTGLVALSGGTKTASGVGIAFPATQSASSDANTLDDYEEGTWTPAYSSTGASFSYNAQYGTYTKIGRFVFAQCWIRGQASGTTSNGVSITGLPFTSTSASGSYNTISFGQYYYITFPSGVNNLTGYLSPGSSTISLEYSQNGGSTAQINANILGSINSGFILNVCYQI